MKYYPMNLKLVWLLVWIENILQKKFQKKKTLLRIFNILHIYKPFLLNEYCEVKVPILLPKSHARTRTQLQSIHSSPLTRIEEQRKRPGCILSPYQRLSSASQQLLTTNELPKLTVVTQLGDNITSQHKQSIAPAAITLKGSASNLSLLNQ